MECSDNGVSKRLREAEVKLAAHTQEYAEFKRRMEDHFARNEKDHAHINDHLDNVEKTLSTLSWKIAVVGGVGAAVVVLIGWALKIWRG